MVKGFKMQVMWSHSMSKQMEKHATYPNVRRQVFWFFHLAKPKDEDLGVQSGIVRTL
jgi:hypothetical protein